jgi:putative glutamine amidotransferase
VFFGGTLIPDLPSFGRFNHSKFGEGNDRYHSIQIDSASQLSKITDCQSGKVNSAHHQAVKHVGKGGNKNAAPEHNVRNLFSHKLPPINLIRQS